MKPSNRRKGLELTYSMVDLLSCGMAASLVLFFIVFKVADLATTPAAGVGTPSTSVYLTIDFSVAGGAGSNRAAAATPILALAPLGQELFEAFPHRFREENGVLVADAPQQALGGYAIHRPMPWPSRDLGGNPHQILFQIVEPKAAPWCLWLRVPDTLGHLVESEGLSLSAHVTIYDGAKTPREFEVTGLGVGARRLVGDGPLWFGDGSDETSGQCS